MLILSRKRNEEIYIGSDVTIQVLSIHGKTVRLGITAPPTVQILRSELLGNPDQDTIDKKAASQD